MRTRGGVSRWPLVGPNGPELVDVRGPIAADDIRFALQLVIAGAGIGTLIFAPGTRTSLRPPLVRVLPEYIVQGPKLFVVTPPARRLPLGVALLRDFLVRAYGSATPAGAVPNEQPRQQRNGSERESRQRARAFGVRKKRA